MLHINYETFYATLPVRFVHTNELQLVNCKTYEPPNVRCASCAPMNYNRDCPGAIAPVGLVRSVRTNELQQI